MKWDNNFSWSYSGEVTDSIKERVKAAGGNVTGDLCCRLAWDYTDDLDLFIVEPDGGKIYFGNRGTPSRNGGKLDVDANGGSGIARIPQVRRGGTGGQRYGTAFAEGGRSPWSDDRRGRGG